MEHERVVRDGLASQADVVTYVVEHYYPEQLFEGLFDDDVVRRRYCSSDGGEKERTPDVPVLQFIRNAGVTLADALARKAQRHNAALAWITPVPTRPEN